MSVPIDLMPVSLDGFGLGSIRRKFETVIYYRKPARFPWGAVNLEPNWIVAGDSSVEKRQVLEHKGFVPLPQFGRIWDEPTDPSGRLFNKYGMWGPILAHPDGPGMFPADQVTTYRWYSEDGIRASCRGGLPCKPADFTQLVRALQGGETLKEYPCVACNQRTFLKGIHLARHLKNTHDWQQGDIMSLGQTMGIDFSQEFRPVKPIEIANLGEPSRAVSMPAPPVSLDLPIVQVTPANPEKPRGLCVFCSKAKKGYCKKHPPKDVA